MLRVEGLSAAYGRHRALEDICAVFAPGQITVLAGPNGSGKSTLLKTLAGLAARQGGDAYWQGESLFSMQPSKRAATLSYLAQFSPPGRISAGRLVLHGRFPHLSYPRRYGAEDRLAARRCLERLGIEDLEHRQVDTLSGGQRQKVYLAMALATEAPVLLMDEPATYLDLYCQLELLALLRELRAEGKAVVAVMHDLPQAMELADSLLLLQQGRAVAQGEPGALAERGIFEQVFGLSPHAYGDHLGRQRYYFARKEES